ncbi:MAG: galactose mutarotase [Prevotellaceae bacterium]|nr:galactose mutarotase [Prevotellaceae bacterium]
MKISYRIEAYTSAGESVARFRITNKSGAYVEFTNWGARWITASMPDSRGQKGNLLIGYNTLSAYLDDQYYTGATVGRFANRISNASFTIDGKRYQLECNDGKHSNHGGFTGFHSRLWQWEHLSDGIRFCLKSPDGDGGYPGNIEVIVDYRLNEYNELLVRHFAKTDRPTYLNMTNHAYFNLSATGEKIIDHWLQIPSTHILNTTPEFIPTEEIVEVTNTPFDFTHLKQIGRDLYEINPQLVWNKGYNHYYILKEENSSEMVLAASLYEAKTGRYLTVRTDLPGVLLYTAGYYERPDTAVCLETQFYPDTPSHSSFPSCLIEAGEVYEHYTVYSFYV